jgi:hypothetical protein
MTEEQNGERFATVKTVVYRDNSSGDDFELVALMMEPGGTKSLTYRRCSCALRFYFRERVRSVHTCVLRD